MTDKEIIEIDGINVLECEHYQYKSLKDCEMRYSESGDCEIGLLNYLFNGNLDIEKYCKDNPNCYFKQLRRKEQECEELKKQLMQKDEVNKFFNTPIEGWSSNPCDICESKNNYEQLTQECDTLKSQLDFEVQQKECIEQECEELKEENQKLEMQLCNDCAERDDYNIPCKMIRDSDYGLQKEIEDNDRYRKALEEIEKVINNILNSCLGRNTVGCRPAHNVCGDLIKILDIINKAKEQ